MGEDDRRKLTLINVFQASVSMACITCASVAIAMSVKQLSAHRIDASYSYRDIAELREDVWLGISSQANDIILLLAIAWFAPVVVLAATRRSVFHYIASIVSGLALLAAGILWALLPRA